MFDAKKARTAHRMLSFVMALVMAMSMLLGSVVSQPTAAYADQATSAQVSVDGDKNEKGGAGGQVSSNGGEKKQEATGESQAVDKNDGTDQQAQSQKDKDDEDEKNVFQVVVEAVGNFFSGVAEGVTSFFTKGVGAMRSGNGDSRRGYQYAILETEGSQAGTLSFIRSETEYTFLNGDNAYDSSQEGQEVTIVDIDGTQHVGKLYSLSSSLDGSWASGAGQTGSTMPAWYPERANVTKVASTASQTITGFDHMDNMFNGMSNATSIDLAGFDTTGVRSLQSTFQYAGTGGFDLNLGDMDTSSVTTMQRMFYGSGVRNLDLSGFDTRSLTCVNSMFMRSALVSLDTTGWDTSGISGTDMQWLFSTCSSLKDPGVENWDVSNVTSLSDVFASCKSLESLDLSKWNTASLKSLERTFKDCQSLTEINLSGWDTDQVTSMGQMFYDCYALQSLDLSSFSTASNPAMGSMFYYCKELVRLTLGSDFAFSASVDSTDPSLAKGYDWYQVVNASGVDVPVESAPKKLWSELRVLETASLHGTWEKHVLDESDPYDLPVRVIWNDNSDEKHLRPANVSLTIDGTDYVITGTGDEWSYTIEDIPFTAAATVPTPQTVRHYTYAKSPNAVTGGEMTITYNLRNKLVDYDSSLEIPIRVIFNDDNDAYGNRPVAVSVTAKSTGYGYEIQTVTSDPITIGPDGTGSATVTVPSRFMNGDPLSYTISKPVWYDSGQGIAGYSCSPASATVSGEGTADEVVFTFDQACYPLDVSVSWMDGDASSRPESIVATIYNKSSNRDFGQVVLRSEDAQKSGEGDAVWTWTGVMESVPYSLSGTNADWGIRLSDIDGYEVLLVTGLRIVSSPSRHYQVDAMLFSSDCPSEGSLSVPVSVVWDDSDDAAGKRPAGVTLSVGVENVGGDYNKQGTSGKAISLSESNGWSGTISGLPASDPTGAAITYRIYQNGTSGGDVARLRYYNIPDYSPSQQLSGSGEHPITITNRYQQNPNRGAFAITLNTWGDGADPNQQFDVTVSLDDDTITGEYGDLTFANGVASFSMKSGQTVTAGGLVASTKYEVSVGDVPNYQVSISGANAVGWYPGPPANTTITGTYVNPSPSPVGTTSFALTRTDPAGSAASGPIQLQVVEELPSEVTALQPTDYPMTVTATDTTQTVVNPAYDDASTPNTLTYTPSLNDGDSLSVPLIRGSKVKMRSLTSSQSIDKTSGEGDGEDGWITFDVGSTDLEPTVIEAKLGSDPTPGVVAEGTITIAPSAVNAGSTYDAYRVFQGPVSTDGGQDKASSLAWDASAPKAAILSFLDQNGYNDWLAGDGHASADLHDNPMLAAQFISEKIADTTASPTAVAASGDQPRTTTGGSFATGLAAVLVASGTPQANEATPGTAYQNEQGYYLFVTKPSTINNSGTAGTAPIWSAITSTPKAVTEKVAVPTLTKQVQDDASGATYGKAADANVGQDLPYRLTATMPENVLAYGAYGMTFTDTLPSGMSLAGGDTSSVVVTLGGTDITSLCSVSYESDVLTVVAANLMDQSVASAGVTLTADSNLVVDYRAHLDADYSQGSAGNMNGAVLTYSADPMDASVTSQTPQQNTFTYAHTLSVEKVDRETRLPLGGAQFTIVDDASGKFVAADGTLSDSEVRLTTDASNGTITVSGVDSGTYTIAEVAAPAGYRAVASTSLTITPSYDAAGAIASPYAVSASGENFADVVAPATTVGANEDGVSIVDASLLRAGVRISDLREIVLPLTGMPLGMGVAIYGSILLAVSLAVYIRNKRIKDQIAELEDMEG